MKLNKKLLLFAAVMALAFAITACGGTETPDTQQPAGNDAGQSAVTESETQPETETQPEEQPKTESTFDAAAAVSAEEISDGVKYTFNAMPQNADDIRALLEILPQSDRHNTAALFMVSIVRYIDNADDGLAMIDALKGPQLLSDTDKAFIKERFSDKKYLPKAYFEGATPENNYLPDQPWTLIIYDDPVEAPEGYSYVNVKTTGADSPRRICMRIKDDNHYLWEYNGVLMSIRTPAEEDPWL